MPRSKEVTERALPLRPLLKAWFEDNCGADHLSHEIALALMADVAGVYLAGYDEKDFAQALFVFKDWVTSAADYYYAGGRDPESHR